MREATQDEQGLGLWACRERTQITYRSSRRRRSYPKSSKALRSSGCPVRVEEMLRNLRGVAHAKKKDGSRERDCDNRHAKTLRERASSVGDVSDERRRRNIAENVDGEDVHRDGGGTDRGS